MDEIKTKKAVEVLKCLGVAGKDKAVIVADEGETIATRSLKNIPGVTAIPAKGLNVYDILNAKYLVITEKGLAGVTERLSAGASN
jgi:large subunit ribosomal protein L4